MTKPIRIPERQFSREENDAARLEELAQKQREKDEMDRALENDEPILDRQTMDDRRGGVPLPLYRLFR